MSEYVTHEEMREFVDNEIAKAATGLKSPTYALQALRWRYNSVLPQKPWRLYL